MIVTIKPNDPVNNKDSVVEVDRQLSFQRLFSFNWKKKLIVMSFEQGQAHCMTRRI